MKFLSLTPGTGSFYCGTCLRDNTLVAAMQGQGHDAALLPLYLAPTLDEASTAAGMPLFYGGINVYLQQMIPLFRKTPRMVDRVFDSSPLLQIAASRASSTQPRDLGDLTVSTLRGEQGHQAKELTRLIDWLRDAKPDVVCLSNALLVGLAKEIKRATGARIVCTLQGEDGFLDSLPERDRTTAWEVLTERAADVDAFIAVSHYYAEVMTRRARLRADRVHVVWNGIALDGYAPASTPPEIPALGFFARMHPCKGLATLVDAFVLLRQNGRLGDLQLRIGGSMTTADAVFVNQQKKKLAAAGLANAVEFHPNLSRADKIAFLQGLTVLSVPATYGESFGLYVIEALAAGVPVVQPRHAAFPELLEATGGGLLCEPDDAQSLATEVEQLLTEPERARELGDHGRQAVQAKFSAAQMAKDVLAVLENL